MIRITRFGSVLHEGARKKRGAILGSAPRGVNRPFAVDGSAAAPFSRDGLRRSSSSFEAVQHVFVGSAVDLSPDQPGIARPDDRSAIMIRPQALLIEERRSERISCSLKFVVWGAGSCGKAARGRATTGVTSRDNPWMTSVRPREKSWMTVRSRPQSSTACSHGRVIHRSSPGLSPSSAQRFGVLSECDVSEASVTNCLE